MNKIEKSTRIWSFIVGLGVLVAAHQASAKVLFCGPLDTPFGGVSSMKVSCEVYYIGTSVLPASASTTVDLINISGSVVATQSSGASGVSIPRQINWQQFDASDFADPYICRVTTTGISSGKLRVTLVLEGRDAGGNTVMQSSAVCKSPF
jgi:hypothetical protein